MKIDKMGMFAAFKMLGKPALAMNHYDLAAAAPEGYTAEEWKTFLSEPEVTDYIRKEMEIIRTSEVNKIVQESSDSRSVAKAQLLASLQRMETTNDKPDGPVFIYCYVPLNDQQEHAPNVKKASEENGIPT